MATKGSGQSPAGDKWGAYELFGEMRSSTDEEREAYSRMLERLSKPIEPGQSVFDMLNGAEGVGSSETADDDR